MSVADVLRILGWVQVGTRRGHGQYKHPSRRGRLTVAGNPGDGLAPGSLESLLKQSGYSIPPRGERR
ncbi:MAG TPA: type II toxin-antitoxin system HicA family toxin [Burkholderiales bacterium]|jgi:predicted RNA binding protein YcfA (HicA-like mRNA interferase family)|nr:type II toxin-antitoxin system HicA family toxin [Burkholderiales bacterium]